jgi:hypothetical protein
MTERERLENLIADAADGLLNKYELRALEKELTGFPDLLEDYRQIMQLPGMGEIYGDTDKYQNESAVHNLITEFDRIDERQDITDTGYEFIKFSRYAIAASLAIFAVLSLFYLTQGEFTDSYLTAEEMFYPMEESAGEDYVLYLNELFESN